jgi:hypothetical protein
LAKTSPTSAQNRRSSGETPDTKDPLKEALYKELGSIGRRPYPLTPATLLGRKYLHRSTAVVARAGKDASDERSAQCASEVLHELITHLPDDTDRRVAEAAFALDPLYQGHPIYKRQELLTEYYAISVDEYAARRPDVFKQIIFGLRMDATPQPRVVEEGAGIVSLPVEVVLATAMDLYCASVATRILISERRRVLGKYVHYFRSPNPHFYRCYVRFLLASHRYLHTADEYERATAAALTEVHMRILKNGPFDDPVYLAHVYGGSDGPSKQIRDDYDAALRGAWSTWYEYHDTHGAGAGSELHALSLSAAEIQFTVPRHKVHLHGFAEKRVGPATEQAHEILENYMTIHSSYVAAKSPSVRPSVWEHESTRAVWLVEVKSRLAATVRDELAARGKPSRD